MNDFYIGLDLGQTQDPTAIVVVEQTVEMGKGINPITFQPQENVHFDVRHLERMIGVPYPEVATRVRDIAKRLAGGRRRPQLVVDGTGVGRPVVDMLRAAGIAASLTAVTIHGGDAETFVDGYYRVPKRNLCGRLAVMLQEKELRIAAELPLADVLIRELLNFKVSISKTGHDTYAGDWREREHDDTVLALGLALWWAKQPKSAWRSEPLR